MLIPHRFWDRHLVLTVSVQGWRNQPACIQWVRVLHVFLVSFFFVKSINLFLNQNPYHAILQAIPVSQIVRRVQDHRTVCLPQHRKVAALRTVIDTMVAVLAAVMEPIHEIRNIRTSEVKAVASQSYKIAYPLLKSSEVPPKFQCHHHHIIQRYGKSLMLPII